MESAHMLRGIETPPEDTSMYHMGCEIAVTAELLSATFANPSDPSIINNSSIIQAENSLL